jgi:hypothetical protein
LLQKRGYPLITSIAAVSFSVAPYYIKDNIALFVLFVGQKGDIAHYAVTRRICDDLGEGNSMAKI